MRIFRYWRWVSAISGIALLASSAGPVSGAAAAAQTMIVMSPIPDVTYGQLTVTFQGTLETRAQSASEAQPIAGEPISFQLLNSRAPADLGSVTTGADGTFSLTVTLPAPGQVLVRFGGDSNYGSTAVRADVSPVQLPTRVTLDPLPATTVAYNHVSFTGNVQIQTPDGQWIPAPEAIVEIKDANTSLGPAVLTDSAGDFTIGENPADPGPWSAVVVGDSGSFAAHVASAEQTIAVSPAPVEIDGFTAAWSKIPTTSLAASQGLAFIATVWSPLVGQNADLYFRPRGSSAWSLAGSYPVPRFGAVAISGISGYIAKGRPREGSWQLRVAATPTTQAASSPVITVEVYLSTSFRNVKIKKVGKTAYLQGQLYSEAGPLAGQKVGMYYDLDPGNAAAHLVTTITTKSGGAFSIKLPAKHRWYYVYAKNLKGDYEDVASRNIYFSS